MDKQEYKIRAEEIRVLVEEKNYKEAADIADTIDWRRVKNVKMLCMVSDVYKMVRRYEDSKTILEMAYEKHPGSRMIVFALAELCLKQGDVVNAWEYYKEFCQIAPSDSRRYILLYKVYAAQEVSTEEQIKVLEKLKEEDYIDRWVYELAYLYHKIGFGTKCVEECDEMILWLGEGRYVRKAMELKMQHEPLTPKQQALYDGVRQKEIETGETQVISDLNRAIVRENENQDVSKAPTIRLPLKEVEDDIQVKILDDSPYNTINLQQALAKDMKLLMEGSGTELFFDGDEEEAVVDTGDLGLQEESEEEETDYITRHIIAPMLEDTQEVLTAPEPKRQEEVFFEDPNTTDLSETANHTDMEQPHSVKTEASAVEIPEEKPPTYEEESSVSGVKKVIVPTVQGILKVPKETMHPTYFAGQKSGFDEILSQGADGQLALVVPEKEKVEKQITGQMSIQDILQEWEQMKRDKEASLKDNVQKSVLDRTGEIFAEFEASKDALIRELEKTAKEVEKEAAQTLSEELEAEEPYEEAENELRAEESVSEYLTEEEDVQTDNGLPAEGDLSAEEELSAEETPFTEENLPEEHRPEMNDRLLSAEEKELFETFVQSRRAKGQLLHILDNMSLAAYTGNVLITGEEDAGTINFARNLVRDMQMSDRNFSGKAAKISGKTFNKKNPREIVEQMKNGALIISEAGGMNCSTVEELVKALQIENAGIIVMLVDTKGAINSLLEVNAVLAEPFNTRIDIEALDDNALVAYGKKFAYDKEYGIDEMGVLALHTRIADMQTAQHSVTTSEVRELVKQAIRHAEKKTPKHFFDVLLGKRYDKEDMIVLREEDFLID